MEQITPYLGPIVVGVIALGAFIWADLVVAKLERIEKQLKRLNKKSNKETDGKA